MVMVKIEAEENSKEEEEGGDGDVASLKAKAIMELEEKLREEKEMFNLHKADAELASFISSHELYNHQSTIARLQERILLMEEDCRLMKDREQSDRERIRSLSEELERKEGEFKDRVIALKTESTGLERARMKAMEEVYQWKNRFVQLEARASRVFEENMKLKEKCAKGNDGSGNVEVVEKVGVLPEEGSEEQGHVTKRVRMTIIPIANGARSAAAFLAMSSDGADAGVLPSAAVGGTQKCSRTPANQNCAERKYGANRGCARVTNAQFLSMMAANEAQKISNLANKKSISAVRELSQ